jgi:hypothetical protein
VYHQGPEASIFAFPLFQLENGRHVSAGKESPAVNVETVSASVL